MSLLGDGVELARVLSLCAAAAEAIEAEIATIVVHRNSVEVSDVAPRPDGARDAEPAADMAVLLPGARPVARHRDAVQPQNVMRRHELTSEQQSKRPDEQPPRVIDQESSEKLRQPAVCQGSSSSPPNRGLPLYLVHNGIPASFI